MLVVFATIFTQPDDPIRSGICSIGCGCNGYGSRDYDPRGSRQNDSRRKDYRPNVGIVNSGPRRVPAVQRWVIAL